MNTGSGERTWSVWGERAHEGQERAGFSMGVVYGGGGQEGARSKEGKARQPEGVYFVRGFKVHEDHWVKK